MKPGTAALDRIGEQPKAYVIDMATVSILDSHGRGDNQGLSRARRIGAARAYTSPAPQRRCAGSLLMHGLKPPRVRYRTNLADALEFA